MKCRAEKAVTMPRLDSHWPLKIQYRFFNGHEKQRLALLAFMVDGMRLSFALVLIPAVSYTLATGAYAWQRNWPLSIMYSGYAWAAVGALWLDRLMAK